MNDSERLADLERRVLALENRHSLLSLAPTVTKPILDMSIFDQMERDLDRVAHNIAERQRAVADRKARDGRTD